MHFDFPTLFILNWTYIVLQKRCGCKKKILAFRYGSSPLSNIISRLNLVNFLSFNFENFTTGCFVMYKSPYNINKLIINKTTVSFILIAPHLKTLHVLLFLLMMPFCLPKYDVVSRDQNNNNVATSPILSIKQSTLIKQWLPKLNIDYLDYIMKT